MKVIIGVEQEPRLQFTLDVGGNGVPPRIIVLQPSNEMLVRCGLYLNGKGDAWRYERAGNAIQLNEVELKDWPKFTKLKG